ncbi:A24 family peptidase, partial [bacterium]|nr:A24 family peptidase [bacterium]
IIYPLAEVFNAALVYSIYLKTGWTPDFIYILLLFESLLLIAIIDFRSHLILYQPVVFSIIVQSIWLIFAGKAVVLNSLLGMFVGAGVFHWIAYLYRVLRNKVGLGEGDATLLGLIGFFFGWSFLFPVIFWGAVFGIAGGGLTLILKRQSLNKEIAFGPWLVLAAFLAWYFPDIFRAIPIHIPDNVVLPI